MITFLELENLEPKPQSEPLNYILKIPDSELELHSKNNLVSVP